MFGALASWTSRQAGRGSTFALACAGVAVWAGLGPHFHYSDSYQLFINTGTTIITFLMVFLVQHTQNRDTLALHRKLDGIILAIDKADNRLVGIERLPEDRLQLKAETA